MTTDQCLVLFSNGSEIGPPKRKRPRRKNKEQVEKRRVWDKPWELLQNGIPPDFSDEEEYIKLIKCLYLDTIKRWRDEIMSALSPPTTDHLLRLLNNLYRKRLNERHSQHKGIFSLQILLVNKFTNSFLVTPIELDRSLENDLDLDIDLEREQRMSNILVSNSLSDARRLTHLSLEKYATDSMLALVGQTATNLKYLNISNSCVSDKGLLDLVGVTVGTIRSRPRLARACKQEDVVVSNRFPNWSRPDNNVGAVSLQHLEANLLTGFRWCTNQPRRAFADQQVVPIDAGLVALLRFMPNLKVLKTEMGGRVVFALARHRKQMRLKRPETLPLKLEVLTESHPTASLLKVVAELCPQLRQLGIDWFRHSLAPSASRDDWLVALHEFPNLSHLRTTEIDYKSSKLLDTLPVIGANLVSLHLQVCTINVMQKLLGAQASILAF